MLRPVSTRRHACRPMARHRTGDRRRRSRHLGMGHPPPCAHSGNDGASDRASATLDGTVMGVDVVRGPQWQAGTPRQILPRNVLADVSTSLRMPALHPPPRHWCAGAARRLPRGRASNHRMGPPSPERRRLPPVRGKRRPCVAVYAKYPFGVRRPETHTCFENGTDRRCHLGIVDASESGVLRRLRRSHVSLHGAAERAIRFGTRCGRERRRDRLHQPGRSGARRYLGGSTVDH